MLSSTDSKPIEKENLFSFMQRIPAAIKSFFSFLLFFLFMSCCS